MPKKYFPTGYCIYDRNDAEFLSNRNNWSIAETIREAGFEGITSQQIAEKLGINYKNVAVVTKNLAQMGWTETVPKHAKKVGKPLKGKEKSEFRKPANIHRWARIDCNMPFPEDDFSDCCAKIFSKYSTKISDFAKTFDLIISDSEFNEFKPSEPIHDCGWSHEAHEFVNATFAAIINWLVETDKDFRNVMIKHKMASTDAFDQE